MHTLPTADDVAQAAERLAPWIRRTPTLAVEGPGARPVILKLEGMQRSGSFKLRGALNKLMVLGPDARQGVVTASGGNHGLGVAWAGFLLGVPVQVFVPESAPMVKLAAIERAGAEVVRIPGGYPQAAQAAHQTATTHGKPYLHAYDDPAVIAGQGTVVREFVEAHPEIETIVVAIGGGGLASGAVLAAGGRRVVGVEPFGIPTMHAALRAGRPVVLPHLDSVAADALGAGSAGHYTYALCAAHLDRVELVEDQAIVTARRWLWQHLRQAYEPAASAALAALAGGHLDGDPGPIGVVLCGANTDPSDLP